MSFSFFICFLCCVCLYDRFVSVLCHVTPRGVCVFVDLSVCNRACNLAGHWTGQSLVKGHFPYLIESVTPC